MRTLATLFTLTFLAALAAAVDIQINSPVASTVWDAGAEAKVSWLVYEKGGLESNWDEVKVNLIKGDGDFSNARFIATLATAKPRSGGVTVTLPEELVTGVDYALQIGTPQFYRYSAAFKIKGSEAVVNASGNNTVTETVPAPNKNKTTSVFKPNNGASSLTAMSQLAAACGVVAHLASLV